MVRLKILIQGRSDSVFCADWILIQIIKMWDCCRNFKVVLLEEFMGNTLLACALQSRGRLKERFWKHKQLVSIKYSFLDFSKFPLLITNTYVLRINGLLYEGSKIRQRPKTLWSRSSVQKSQVLVMIYRVFKQK